jgi:hypothetical protein
MLAQSLDLRDQARGNISDADNPSHRLRVIAIRFRVIHAQEEGVASHDDVELRGIGDTECLIVEEYLAHFIVTRRENDSEAQVPPESPQEAKEKRAARSPLPTPSPVPAAGP